MCAYSSLNCVHINTDLKTDHTRFMCMKAHLYGYSKLSLNKNVLFLFFYLNN